MKITEIREKTSEQLAELLKEQKAELFNLDIPYVSEKQDHTVFLFQSMESVKGGRKDEKSSRNSHWSG